MGNGLRIFDSLLVTVKARLGAWSRSPPTSARCGSPRADRRALADRERGCRVVFTYGAAVDVGERPREVAQGVARGVAQLAGERKVHGATLRSGGATPCRNRRMAVYEVQIPGDGTTSQVQELHRSASGAR